MASQEYPTLNGVEPSWADLDGPSFIIYGGPTIKTPDLKAINWEESLEVGTVRGVGGAKRKRTSGQADSGGGITFLQSGWKAVRDALMAVAIARGLSGYGKVPFDVVYQYTPPGDDDSPIHKLKIVAARIVKASAKAAEGPDAQEVEAELNVMRVEQDGASIG